MFDSPVSALPGIGPNCAEQLKKEDCETIGKLLEKYKNKGVEFENWMKNISPKMQSELLKESCSILEILKDMYNHLEDSKLVDMFNKLFISDVRFKEPAPKNLLKDTEDVLNKIKTIKKDVEEKDDEKLKQDIQVKFEEIKVELLVAAFSLIPWYTMGYHGIIVNSYVKLSPESENTVKNYIYYMENGLYLKNCSTYITFDDIFGLCRQFYIRIGYYVGDTMVSHGISEKAATNNCSN